MLYGIEVWQLAAGLVGAVALGFLAFMSAMARFLKRPSPSEAIIRIGRANTDVFIGRSTWIVPVLHRAATMSLSTIGLTIRRASHEALVTKDYISTNLSAEFYIRVEPAEDDVKKAARTIGIDEGHASAEAIRQKSQELLEPKLVGALRAVAAQNDFLALHMNREHFAQEVSKALREDLGRNGFTLESVTITELAQTPLAEMRADDIFGASGRETVTNTVVQKNIAVKRKMQEETERTAEIAQQKAVEAAQVDKQRTIEAAKVDKEITLTLKAKESAEADAKRAEAQALKAQAEQQVITVGQVAEAERDKQVAIVAAQKAAEQERIRAEVEAYKKKVEAEVSAQSIKIRAQADADAAEKQAQSITRLAEANREAGLKEAEVQREKLAAANSKSRELFLQETALRLLEVAPSLVRELVKPAERIGEIKVLQLGGGGNGAGNQPQLPLLGNALGPMMQTILQSSVMIPAMKELMKFVDMNAVAGAVSQAVQVVDPTKVAVASPAPVKAPARIPERPNDAH